MEKWKTRRCKACFGFPSSLAINLAERRIRARPSLSPAATHSWKVAQYEKHFKALDFGHKN